MFDKFYNAMASFTIIRSVICRQIYSIGFDAPLESVPKIEIEDVAAMQLMHLCSPQNLLL